MQVTYALNQFLQDYLDKKLVCQICNRKAKCQRLLEWPPEFERKLKLCTRKEQGLREQIKKEFELRLLLKEDQPPSDSLLKRVAGHPVFKMRVRARGHSKSRGTRIVYYFDHERLLPLMIWVKADKAALDSEDYRQIINILSAHGLWRK